MKSDLSTIAVFSLLTQLSGAEFHNLEFDEANIDRLVTLQPPFSLYRAGTVSDLLPNWSISYDGVSYTGLIQFQAGLLDIPSVWFASAGSNEQGYYFGFVPSAAHDSTRAG